MWLKKFFALPLHVRVAIIVAPFLAVGGWGLTDWWLNRGQSPQNIAFVALETPATCKLGGQQDCLLQHPRLQVRLVQVAGTQSDVVELRFTTSGEAVVRGIQFSVVHGATEQFVVVKPTDNPHVWQAAFPQALLMPPPDALRLAVALRGWVAYAEIQHPAFD